MGLVGLILGVSCFCRFGLPVLGWVLCMGSIGLWFGVVWMFLELAGYLLWCSIELFATVWFMILLERISGICVLNLIA